MIYTVFCNLWGQNTQNWKIVCTIFFLFLRALRLEIGLALHGAMFIPVLERLGTEEQQTKWLPLALSLRVIGTYAQTELGHGEYFEIDVIK